MFCLSVLPSVLLSVLLSVRPSVFPSLFHSSIYPLSYHIPFFCSPMLSAFPLLPHFRFPTPSAFPLSCVFPPPSVFRSSVPNSPDSNFTQLFEIISQNKSQDQTPATFGTLDTGVPTHPDGPALSKTRTVRPATPPEFDGDHSKGQAFLNSCQTYIRLCPREFLDEQTKTLWAMSYMKSVLRNGPPVFSTGNSCRKTRKATDFLTGQISMKNSAENSPPPTRML